MCPRSIATMENPRVEYKVSVRAVWYMHYSGTWDWQCILSPAYESTYRRVRSAQQLKNCRCKLWKITLLRFWGETNKPFTLCYRTSHATPLWKEYLPSEGWNLADNLPSCKTSGGMKQKYGRKFLTTAEAGIPSRLIAFSLPECRGTLQKGASLPLSLSPSVPGDAMSMRRSQQRRKRW